MLPASATIKRACSFVLLSVTALALAACGNDTAPTGGTPSSSTPPQSAAPPTVTRPDNTAVNERDRGTDVKTAGMTGQTKSDVDITAGIRRRIMDSKLSMSAQNSKIVTQDGKVTLRGPVNTQDEKDTIGKFAAEGVGIDKVDNQLEVQPNP